ncbi:hypothetical protein H2199_000141 [Coniosporium tulheliwenetii]|uniref:Uncharacterized protein n=1 Tax=Coniosporium tulheliwenetii TaxID=3383036 RepID=A0ACC2ZP71_9PEZI|nr:hypothetical protein H2199_000141 [Cladosporium sp. JES 115]
MTTSVTSYTPLETLLLFQSLLSYGTDPSVFARISDLLKKNPHIRESKDYDSGRLNPDALRELYDHYLQLLKKDEAKSQVQNTNGAAEQAEQNGGSPSPSRKRKAPSPSLPTVEEATQHAHLIPALVTKLYARYREHVTEEIRAEERRYDQLKREEQEIERGEWDERIRRQELSNGTTSNKDIQASPTVPSRDVPTPVEPAVGSDNRAPGASPVLGNAVPKSPTVRYAQAKIDAVINHDPKPSPKARPVPLERPLQPSPAPQNYALAQQPPLHHRAPAQLSPRLPPPLPSNAGYRLASPALHNSPYSQSHPQHVSGQSPTTPSHIGRPLSSPVMLPPPPGMTLPVPPIQPPTIGGSPPFRGAPSGPLALHSPGSSQRYGPASQQGGPPFPPGPPPPHLQQPGSYYPSYPNHGPYHQPQPQPPPPPPVFRPPHQGGYMLPPFQVTPQDPTRVHQQQQRAQQQAAAATPNRTPASNAQTRAPASGVARPPPPLYSQTSEPVSQPAQRTKPPTAVKRPRPLSLPTRPRPSARTLWTATVPPEQYKMEPPPPPPISPVNDAFPAPLSDEAASASKSQTKGRKKTNAAETPRNEQADAEETPAVRTTRGQPKRTGGGSAASSVVTRSIRGRTRSQSIASHVEDATADAGSASSRRVKPEPSTPANILEDEASAPDATPTATAPPITRRRRGTLQTQPPRPTKRKRSTLETDPSPSASAEPHTPHPELDQQPNTVLASRNFSRMSVPIMNNILRPQVYTLGHRGGARAVNALTSAGAGAGVGARDSPAGGASPGGVGTAVTLERTEELVPPRGIVNSAQLERELMRMFANAVMFNPGEEGVVRDAREMFESVQGAVSNWRSAERRSEDKEDEGGGEEGEGGGSGRRKRA